MQRRKHSRNLVSKRQPHLAAALWQTVCEGLCQLAGLCLHCLAVISAPLQEVCSSAAEAGVALTVASCCCTLSLVAHLVRLCSLLAGG